MEVHLIGEIAKAEGFSEHIIYCHWKMMTDETENLHDWNLYEGISEGLTQRCTSQAISGPAIWNHPIDVHYVTSSVDTWPKIYLEVWFQDVLGRSDIAGYGICVVPCIPGEHKLECVIWRPYGTFCERLSAMFLGGNRRLSSPEKALVAHDRYPLRTLSTGMVHVALSVVITRGSNLGLFEEAEGA